jgi:hypothetical protein
MPTIRVTCPTCATALELDAQHDGQEVQCGSCNQIFVAKKQSSGSSRSSASGSRARDDRDDDDDDDRPRRRSRSRRDDDDDYDDEPRPKPPGTSLATAAMVLGIISLPLSLCCGLLGVPCSILAIIFGAIGLRSPARGQATTGIILGLLGIAVSVAMITLNIGINNFNRNNNFNNNNNNFGQPARFR